jgi:hypothetical protein
VRVIGFYFTIYIKLDSVHLAVSNYSNSPSILEDSSKQFLNRIFEASVVCMSFAKMEIKGINVCREKVKL